MCSVMPAGRSIGARLLRVVAGALLLQAPRAAQAVDYSLAWTGDFAAVASGGLQQGADHMGLVEAGLASEFQLPAGQPVQWRVTVQHTYGGGFSVERVGDLQTVSNVDAERGIRVLEAWVDVGLSRGWSVGAGKYDFNSEFDAIEAGTLFLSSSQGIGPDISQSGTAGPSIFPHTAVGLRVQRELSERSLVRGVVLDADGSSPNRGGPMLAIEHQRSFGEARLVLGGWGYAGEKACIADPQRSDREYGAYVSVESRLGRHTLGYLRIGFANPHVERLGRYVGGAIVYEDGLLPGRDDSIGVAIGVARNGSDYRDGMTAAGLATTAAEYALEATWRIPFGRHLALQPDLQYVIDPGTDPGTPDALVFILRVDVSL
jgi:porin